MPLDVYTLSCNTCGVKFYSTKEAANLLGYNDDSYVRKLVLNGKIDAKKIGRQWMISEEAIHKYSIISNIDNKYKALISFNQELRSITESVLDQTHTGKGPKDHIVAFAVGRMYKSQEAILELCKKGYGEDASVIVRSVFELLVTMLYILKDESDETAYRYFAYDWILRKKMYSYVLSNDEILNEVKRREQNPNPNDGNVSQVLEQAKLAQDKYQYKNNRWSDKSIEEMSKAVGLWRAYKTIYALQCQFAHNLPRIFNDYTNTDGFGFEYYVGLSENWVEENLVITFDFCYHFLIATNEHFSLDLQDKLNDISKRYIDVMKDK